MKTTLTLALLLSLLSSIALAETPHCGANAGRTASTTATTKTVPSAPGPSQPSGSTSTSAGIRH